MNDVLVLNRNYMAVHIITWQKAMCLLYRGHALAIDEDLNRYSFDEWKDLSAMMEQYPNGVVHSTTCAFAIPEIITLAYYDHLPTIEVRFTRSNIYHNYKQICCYCGKKFDTKELNLDHVLPKSKGGTTTWDNIVLSCIPCNLKKADRTPVQAGMPMAYTPHKPHWGLNHVLRASIDLKTKQSWQKFIDSCYWESTLGD
jgi:5-methylcytosine-specific restriction endonuclease McrA